MIAAIVGAKPHSFTVIVGIRARERRLSVLARVAMFL